VDKEASGYGHTAANAIRRFLASPTRRKYITLANRARALFSGNAIPLRLPFGAWWLAEKSALDHELIHNEFEQMETRFVERLAAAGHDGRRCWRAPWAVHAAGVQARRAEKGRVIAFEPSPREFRRLKKHLPVESLLQCAA